MTQLLLSSKTVIQEEQPAVRQIPGVATALPGFVGVTERGPFGATLVTADNYRKLYGGYTANGELLQALDGFFSEGGVLAYVSRTVHYTDPTDPTSKTSAAATHTFKTSAFAATAGRSTAASVGPYALTSGQTLVAAFEIGGDQTITLTGTSPVRTAGGGTYNIPDASTLTVAIDGGGVQTITFHNSMFVDHTIATDTEVAAAINGQLVGAFSSLVGGKVSITSDRKGTGGIVNVTGGSANAGILAFTTGVLAGGGNVSNIAAVTPAEIVAAFAALALIDGAASLVGGAPAITSATTGGTSTAQIKNTSTAVAVGFDNAVHTGLAGTAIDTLKLDGKTDGTYGNALTPYLEAATNGEAARFNVRVVKAGVTVETWPNVTMDNTDPRFVETVINDETTGSDLIKATDLNAAVPAPNDRPANGNAALTGGSDGLAALSDNDFIGGTGTNGRTGMRALDLVLDLSLLAIPGRATSSVHNAMISYCEVTRNGAVFAVLDPPASTSATGMVTYVETTAAIKELSEFAAIYWPRIKVDNPSTTVFGLGSTILVAPSGYVCGVMSRNDAKEGGIYQAPAGTEFGKIFGCRGFETDEVNDETTRDIVDPKLINTIHTDRGQPRYIDGHHTLKTTGNFPSVSERRGVIFLEQSIKDGIQFARHRNNDETLRAEVTRTVTNFLTVEMKKGAFRTKDPSTAYFVDFGAGLNTPAVAFAGKLIGRIGLATQKPVQWTVLNFTQDTRSLAA